MPSLLLIALVAGAVAGATVWLLVSTGGPVVWMVFLGWGSFAAIGGDDRSIVPNIASNLLGVVMAWLVALLSLLNPLPQLIGFAPWIGLLSAVAVVAYILVSQIKPFTSITSASIAFAGSFGFLAHAPGAFTLESLLSFSLQNALILLSISVVLGTPLGILVNRIVGLLASRAASPADSQVRKG